MNPERSVYLGDSVYACKEDSGAIRLTTDSHLPEEAGNIIFLEPDALRAFLDVVGKFA